MSTTYFPIGRMGEQPSHRDGDTFKVGQFHSLGLPCAHRNRFKERGGLHHDGTKHRAETLVEVHNPE